MNYRIIGISSYNIEQCWRIKTCKNDIPIIKYSIK